MIATRSKGRNKTANSKRLWVRNLRVLQRRLPEVTKDVQSRTASSRVQRIKTRSGQTTLRYRNGRGPIHLHSLYDPVQEAKHWAEPTGNRAWQTGIVFGFGMGYHVEELIRRYPERQLIVIVPDPDVFTAVLHMRDLRSVLSHPRLRIMLVSEMNAQVVAAVLFDHLRKHLDQFQLAFWDWPPYRRLWPDFWLQVQKHLGEQSRQELVNLGTYGQFSIDWEKNCLINLRTSVRDPGAPSLYPLFVGKPAILVSSGPSLEKNIHLLAEAKDRAVIVAVGSAIEVLSRHGIEPDLLVSFDAGADNFFPFARLDTHRLPLVYSAIIYPLVLTEYQGPRFVMGIDVYPYERWLYAQLGLDKGLIHSGPSTANPAWDLVRQMGCDPIVFVGQDLALTGNRTHASGVTAAHGVDVDITNAPPGYDVVEDIYGNPVLTTKVMHSMKVWFEQRIAIDRSGRTYIDATEGGARIAGTRVMPLREVIDTYCAEPFDPYRRILDVHEHEKARLHDLDWESRALELLAQVEEELDRVDELCQQSRGPLQKLLEANANRSLTMATHDRIVGDFARLDRKITAIESYKEFVQPALTHHIVAFDKLSSQIRNEPDLHEKGKQLVDLYSGFFGTARQVSGEIRELVRQARQDREAYTRRTLYAELDRVLEISQEAETISMQLETLIASGQMTQETFAQAAGRFHQIDGQLRELEAYWGFIRRMLQRSANYGLPIGMGEMYHLVQQVDAAATLEQKATHIVELYRALVQSLRDAVARLRELIG